MESTAAICAPSKARTPTSKSQPTGRCATASLAVDDQQLKLSGGAGNVYKGTVHMEKDGLYHVAALDQGQPVRLSNDFFIEAQQGQSA